MESINNNQTIYIVDIDRNEYSYPIHLKKDGFGYTNSEKTHTWEEDENGQITMSEIGVSFGVDLESKGIDIP